ncbi:hypothetical protein C3495_11775 [Clostridiaceae bacterium 14S0207]|nr:hypothetical protein C3495_11775 [Clostridiaceae bacterium 14S0207]
MRYGQDEKKKALTEAITNAKEAKKDVQESEDGKEVSTTAYWVKQDVQKVLDAAISAAEGSKAESEEDIKAEAEKLNNAVKVYVAAKKAGSKVGEVVVLDKTAIDTSIKAANKAKENVKESTDGKDVKTTEQWVTKEVKEALEQAITKATEAKNTVKVEKDVTEAATALDNAVKKYTAAKTAGSKAEALLDKIAIDTSIAAAKKAQVGVKESTDGKDVKTTEQWVTKEVKEELDQAIKTATAAKDTVKAEKDVTEAATALDNAVKKYTAAKVAGKQS